MSVPTPADSAFLTAAEAAATLGVKPQTLYAYVSRGWIRSEPVAGGRRRRYLRADVLRLKRHVEVRANPTAAAHHAFTRSEGSILDSSLTLITEEELYYRGLPATSLAATATFEQVTALLWSGDLDAAVAAPEDVTPPAVRVEWLRSDGRPLEPWFAFQSVLPRLAAADPAAEDLRSRAVRRTGARILSAELACVAGGSPVRGTRDPSTGYAAQALASAWGAPDRERAAALIEPALILLADHELNVSTLAARVAASGRASPYHAVLAGLAAVHGTLHGQASTLVAELLRAVGRPERARGGGGGVPAVAPPAARLRPPGLPDARSARRGAARPPARGGARTPGAGLGRCAGRRGARPAGRFAHERRPGARRAGRRARPARRRVGDAVHRRPDRRLDRPYAGAVPGGQSDAATGPLCRGLIRRGAKAPPTRSDAQ